MVSTVPEMTIDMIGALLSVPASEFGKYGDKLLLIQSQFGELDFVNGYFLMIPELESYDKLLESLGVHQDICMPLSQPCQPLSCFP